MDRTQRCRLLVAVVALAAVALAGPVRGQPGDVLTIIEPAGDLLYPDTDAEAHITTLLSVPAAESVTFTTTIGGRPATPASQRETALGSLRYEHRYPVNPCALIGSDLPGDEIPVSLDVRRYDRPLMADGSPPPDATLTGGELVNRVLTLGPDQRAPVVSFDPPSGLTARPGQEIEFFVLALEVNEPGNWASGVQKAEARGPDGALIGEADFSGGGQLACEAKVRNLRARQTYTVPMDAREGQPLDLTATVTDWSGNAGSRVMRLLVSTREEYEATFSFGVDAPDGDRNVVSFGERVSGQARFTIDRSLTPTFDFGLVEGSGTATRATHGGRNGDCTVAYSRPPAALRLTVQGYVQDGRLVLLLVDPTPSTATLTLTCPGGAETGTVPWAGVEAIHFFPIEMPLADGARFTINERLGGLLVQGELTLRRVAPAVGAAAAIQEIERPPSMMIVLPVW